MSYYEVLLFVHVLGVAIWFGTGLAMLVLGNRFERSGDNGGLKSLFEQVEWISTPSSFPSPSSSWSRGSCS